MRKVLITVQVSLFLILFMLSLMLAFHRFGQRREMQSVSLSLNLASAPPSLEQMRTWSDLIVQKNLFSPQRGEALPQSAEPWAKDAPPFELVAVFVSGGERRGIFIPAGADKRTTVGVTRGAGGGLAEKTTVVEMRENSAIIRKFDGLYELKLPRSAATERIKISAVQ